METQLSLKKKICSLKTFNDIKNIYLKNNLDYTYKRYTKINLIEKLIPFLNNDKKNNDKNINFILLKNIGKTDLPNKNKISINYLKKFAKTISQY